MGTSITKSSAQQHPGFRIACGIFAVTAFAQLLAVGVSIASRTGETREVIRYVERDPIIVSVPTLRDEPAPDTSVAEPLDVDAILKKYGDSAALQPEAPTPPPIPDNLSSALAQQQPAAPETPTIANPLVEKLVMQAKQAHIKSDLIDALTKLEEAEVLAPEEPAVYYAKAQLFEDMGNWDKATDNYEKLFTMGLTAGVYYHKAAYKLSHGFGPDGKNQDLFIIGNILRRISDDKRTARLTIPIRSTPDGEFDASLLEVKVHHYDLVDNKTIEAVPPARADNIQSRWLQNPPTWFTHEEFAESVYTIPQATARELRIFGDRKYFGYVAELYYKNELIDQQAFPRRLHAIHAKQNAAPNFLDQQDFPFDEVLPNINPDNPLLPSLPQY